MEKGLAFRALHSHGRALIGAGRARGGRHRYLSRPRGRAGAGGSTAGTSATATSTTSSSSRRCRRSRLHDGELRVVVLEGQPAHVQRQHYRIYDAATGLIEEGWVDVAEMRRRGPWLEESFEFPVERVRKAGAPPAVVERRGRRRRRPQRARVRGRAGPRGVGVTVLEAEDTIGGGARSGELTLPGLVHDHCSAVHPMAVGSPFLALASSSTSMALARDRLAHPLDDGSAGVMLTSIEETARALGRRAGLAPGCSPPVAGRSTSSTRTCSSRSCTCRGIRSAWSGSACARRCRRPRWPASGGGRRPRAVRGVAAHAISALDRPMSSVGRHGPDLRVPRLRLGRGPRRLAVDRRRAAAACASTAGGSRPGRGSRP